MEGGDNNIPDAFLKKHGDKNHREHSGSVVECLT